MSNLLKVTPQKRLHWQSFFGQARTEGRQLYASLVSSAVRAEQHTGFILHRKAPGNVRQFKMYELPQYQSQNKKKKNEKKDERRRKLDRSHTHTAGLQDARVDCGRMCSMLWIHAWPLYVPTFCAPPTVFRDECMQPASFPAMLLLHV